MRFEEKRFQLKPNQIWEEYCGFLDLNLESFMVIQRRLLEEQASLWCRSSLGQKICPGYHPSSVEEFRARVPLTTYADYAELLALKDPGTLPGKPVVWIETTWEGGNHPVKLAPHTREMLDTYRNNIMAIFMLSTSEGKGHFRVHPHDRMLYGLAPLPYATGLLPLLLDEEIKLEFLPPVKDAEHMSFGERNRKGFQLGMKKGIDLFFGLSSVISYISLNFRNTEQSRGSLRTLMQCSPRMAVRLVRASLRCRREGRALMPKDLFRLHGFVCAGTDSRCYKKQLTEAWGRRPLEITAGTEPTCIATESWEKNGLYFFPDACLYEFIPEEEMQRNFEDPGYQPRTYLMDEVVANRNYELVITVFKGGAFARYRVGDVYRCLSIPMKGDEIRLPRFEFVDRVPWVIDIAGFTRITEQTIADVIQLSGLDLENWVVKKEYTDQYRPYMNLYVELPETMTRARATSRELLTEHLSVYFRYLDHDYHDLKKLLGMEPLVITMVKSGTFERFERKYGKLLQRMNPREHDLQELLRLQSEVERTIRVVK